jgi:hypothetical protein
MKILLLSMPDSFEHMPAAGVRMPNGALSSLAGNIDSHHQVAIADLILVQRRVRKTLHQLIVRLQPDVVGLSIMTFQRKTAKSIIDSSGNGNRMFGSRSEVMIRPWLPKPTPNPARVRWTSLSVEKGKSLSET